MKVFTLFISLPAILAFSCLAQAPANDYQPLLAGKEAQAWKASAGASLRLGAEGVATSIGPDSASLPFGAAWFTDRKLGDFYLRTEFRANSPAFRSGILLRYPQTPLTPQDVVKMAGDGYCVAISDGQGPHEPTGSISGVKKASRESLRPTGQWNQLDISAVGQNYKVLLNGKSIMEFTGKLKVDGYLGIECNKHGAVEFRNLRLKEIRPASPDIPSPPPAVAISPKTQPNKPAPKPSAPPSSVRGTSSTLEERAKQTEFDGMVLSPKWLPNVLDRRKGYQSSLAWYATIAVGNEPRGQEKGPDTIWGPIKWLMPVEEAIKKVPKNGLLSPEVYFTNDSFPAESLKIQAIPGKFVDRGLPFNWIYLLFDLKRQVVSVEFVEQTPNVWRWVREPRFYGTLDPYYDFINVKNSSRGGAYFLVFYDQPGLPAHEALIKTTLDDPLPLPRPPYYLREDVHWYLPAPLAGRLLDIAEKHEAKPANPILIQVPF